MVIGAVVTNGNSTVEILRALVQVREKHALRNEIKWTRVSNNKFDAYKDFIDLFFDLKDQNRIHFHSIIVNMHKVNNRKFNEGDREIFMRKMTYQLLIKIGRHYQSEANLNVYLDHRETKHPISNLQNVLNAGIARRWAVGGRPFKRVVYRDSKTSDLIQLNDILIGAVAHRKNRRYEEPGASQAKVNLAQHIISRLNIRDLCDDTPARERRFTIWNIKLQDPF